LAPPLPPPQQHDAVRSTLLSQNGISNDAFIQLGDQLRRKRRVDEIYSQHHLLQRRAASSQILSSQQPRYRQIFEEELNALTSGSSTTAGVAGINHYNSIAGQSPPLLSNHLLGSHQQSSLRYGDPLHHQTSQELIHLRSSSTLPNLATRAFPTSTSTNNLALDQGIMQDGSLLSGLHDIDQIQELRRLASSGAENEFLAARTNRLLSYDQQRRLLHPSMTDLLSSDRTGSTSNSLLSEHQIMLRRQQLLNERNQSARLTETLSNIGTTVDLGRPSSLSDNGGGVVDFSSSNSRLGGRGTYHTQGNSLGALFPNEMQSKYYEGTRGSNTRTIQNASLHAQTFAGLRDNISLPTIQGGLNDGIVSNDRGEFMNATNNFSEFGASLPSGSIESTRRYLNQSYDPTTVAPRATTRDSMTLHDIATDGGAILKRNFDGNN
jgi:hypothetical protein